MKRHSSIDSGTIREASTTDLPAILALLTEAGLTTAGVRDHLHTFLVATDAAGRGRPKPGAGGGHVLGTAGLEVYGDVALLRSVAVLPPRQGQGLGGRLVTTALAEARRRGVRQVALLTASAAAFFSRFGFQPVDRAALDRRLLASAEFGDACCETAVAMQRGLTGRESDA